MPAINKDILKLARSYAVQFYIKENKTVEKVENTLLLFQNKVKSITMLRVINTLGIQQLHEKQFSAEFRGRV